MGVEALLGKTVTKIRGAYKDSGSIIFTCSDGTEYRMYHRQSCCETVTVEDICGDIENLVGSQMLMAEDVSSDCHEGALDELDESYTWTWYKFATIKGYVTIRWYGYYSEEVDFEEVTEED